MKVYYNENNTFAIRGRSASMGQCNELHRVCDERDRLRKDKARLTLDNISWESTCARLRSELDTARGCLDAKTTNLKTLEYEHTKLENDKSIIAMGLKEVVGVYEHRYVEQIIAIDMCAKCGMSKTHVIHIDNPEHGKGGDA